MSEKADYTNLERLQAVAKYGDECPEHTAEYLYELGCCPRDYLKCSESPSGCRKCITAWLNEKAEA